MQLIKMFI